MDNLSRNWIFPIFDAATDCISGQSFAIGNSLITAAHVIDLLEDPYVLIDGKKFVLRKEEASHFVHEPGSNIDCAIFALPQAFISPLQLGNIEIATDNLICLYVGYTHHPSDGSIGVQLKSSEAQYLATEENAFLCKVAPMLNSGCSGGPIISGEYQVVGMLVGGDDESICGFQRGRFISELIANGNS